MNKAKLIENQPTKKVLERIFEGQSTAFENVEYQGMYDVDKPFTIMSEEAYILDEEPEFVYMTNVHTILYLADGRIVNINADKGKYNKVTYDCFFKQNVKATDGEIKIFSENLDLVATANSVKIYKDVILNYPTGSLVADKINYDFETKYFKVSMFDDKTVKIKVTK
jgi:lipopolysaccharide export system protein LptA